MSNTRSDVLFSFSFLFFLFFIFRFLLARRGYLEQKEARRGWLELSNKIERLDMAISRHYDGVATEPQSGGGDVFFFFLSGFIHMEGGLVASNGF
jgi:hypothetical protein